MFYKNKYSTIYNGDCIEVMKNLIEQGVKIDKVITSPPYNIFGGGQKDRGYQEYQDNKSEEQYIEWTIEYFNLYEKLLNENGCIVFNLSYGNQNPNLFIKTINGIVEKTNFTLIDTIVWRKQNAMPIVAKNKLTRICEFIFVFCLKGEEKSFTTNKKELSKDHYENVFNYIEAKNNDETQELNKCTYSTSLVRKIIDIYVNKNDVVLDNFSGTGTTSLACQRHDIKSIGIEMSVAQCEYTKKRLEKDFNNLFNMEEL